jgi:hypothetical protein
MAQRRSGSGMEKGGDEAALISQLSMPYRVDT